MWAVVNFYMGKFSIVEILEEESIAKDLRDKLNSLYKHSPYSVWKRTENDE